MNSFISISQKIENAKALDFGSILNSVIDMYKKVWLKGFLVVLFIMVFLVGISLLFSLIGLSPAGFPFVNGYNLDSYFEFYYTNIIYSIPQSILVSTITMAFVSAFYKMCKQICQGQNSVDDYFYFFKKEYFSKLLMLGVIHTTISIVAQLLFVIPAIYVFVPLSYFAIIFSNNPHLSELEIVKASFKLGHKKWLITFSALLVTGVLGILGMIACFIGMVFTISIVYLPVFFIYKEVVGFDDADEIEQIGALDDSD